MESRSAHLPIRQKLTFAYAASLLIALLIAVASVTGIVYRTTLYPSAQLVGNVGTDGFNLVLGLPILLGSMWFARRGSLMGLLFWPGALLLDLYVYVAYLVGVPFNALFLLYLVIVTLSAYTLIGLVAQIDAVAVRQRFMGVVPARTVGGILAVLALLFIARTMSVVVSALVNSTAVNPIEQATWVSDFAVECPLLLVAGVLLWRRKSLGYVAGAGLLLQIGVLFLSLPISGVLSALLIGAPLDTSLAWIVIFGVIPLALIRFFVPFNSKQKETTP